MTTRSLQPTTPLVQGQSSAPPRWRNRLRGGDPDRPLAQVLFYRLCAWVVLAFFVLVYRARVYGAERIPARGGLLVIANHQSHFDPPLVGVALLPRHAAMIARQSLFRFPLGLMLRGFGAIPIKDDEGDAGAMRAAIAQLSAGRVVVIFPEGSRTPDGRMQPFKRGVWLLMTRARATVLPAAVDGCFEVFPRTARRPRLFSRRLAVAFGEPLAFETLKAMGSEAGLAELARRVETLRGELADK